MTEVVGKAWQRLIRERQADAERLSGEPWRDYEADISKAEVRRVSYATAREVIQQYEWLGRMPAVVSFCYGVYFADQLAGVVVYGPEYGENLGVWDKYGYTGKIILLARGACVHWAHPHTASKLIRGSMRLLPERFEVVTATVDSGAGEVGTIYQACNFDYVGPMGSGHRGCVVNGKLYTSRNMKDVFDTESIKKIQARFGVDNVKVIKEPAKGRYFAFRGGKIARKHNRAAIAHIVKPYPRRSVGAAPAELYEGLQAA